VVIITTFYPHTDFFCSTDTTHKAFGIKPCVILFSFRSHTAPEKINIIKKKISRQQHHDAAPAVNS